MRYFLILLLGVGLLSSGIGQLQIRAKVKGLEKKIEMYKQRGYVRMPYWVDPQQAIGDLVVAGASLVNEHPSRYLVLYARADEVNRFIDDARLAYAHKQEEQSGT